MEESFMCVCKYISQGLEVHRFVDDWNKRELFLLNEHKP